MQALKALVTGMGILIVAGMFLLGYGIYKKAEDPSFTFFKLGDAPQPSGAPSPASQAPPLATMAPAAAPTAPPMPPRAFGRAVIPLAAIDRVEEVEATGDRLFVRVSRGDGSREILVIDANSGAVLGTLELRDGR
ncbi:MAG: hypothetical protein OQJ99_05010 [Rhodospirillales bacterium]|nr:hypothetical protein [Rhodospirillales bacterium]MCW9003058.1 hypothetical protein [Rhodospirillales bacterium]